MDVVLLASLLAHQRSFFGEESASTDTSLGRYTRLDQESQHDINHEPC